MTTRDLDADHERHPDWRPDVRDCPFEACAVCGPAELRSSNIVATPAEVLSECNIVLGEN